MGRSLGNTGMHGARRAYFSLLLVYRHVIQEFYSSISITMFFWKGLMHAQSVDTRPFSPHERALGRRLSRVLTMARVAKGQYHNVPLIVHQGS